MPVLARMVGTPVVVDVRPGAIDGLAELLRDGRISAGGQVAVAVGPGLGEQLAQDLAGTLPDAEVVLVEGGSIAAARELVERLRGGSFDALVGIGGGRTLDTGKYAASLLGLPFVVVATNLAHDGIASPVASLETEGRKSSFGVHLPLAVFVDIDLVQEAPQRHTRSGIGDVLSNLNALADWELSHLLHGESVDGLAATLARTAAQSLLRPAPDVDLGDPNVLTAVAEALILSGLAMAIAGSSRPCSGACHEISHALDMFHASPGMHGEQVAVGALFATYLRGGGEFGGLDAALRIYGVPRTPSDLGITDDVFVDAVLRGPSTRPERFTILEHLALDEAAVRTHLEGFYAAVT